jgi:hypothetical protein
VTGQRQDAAEAEQAAISEWARDLVATWPPLTESQREQLRELLDLGGQEPGHDDPH